MNELELGLKMPDPNVVEFCCFRPNGVRAAGAAAALPKGDVAANGGVASFF